MPKRRAPSAGSPAKAKKKAYSPVGFALGRLRGAGPLYRLGHILTVAPTGAGKGVGAVIPNLLTYQGSAFVLDIKGENFRVTARARAEMGHDIRLVALAASIFLAADRLDRAYIHVYFQQQGGARPLD
jgi:hypothetical protein